jgi:hypothetical protein
VFGGHLVSRFVPTPVAARPRLRRLIVGDRFADGSGGIDSGLGFGPDGTVIDVGTFGRGGRDRYPLVPGPGIVSGVRVDAGGTAPDGALAGCPAGWGQGAAGHGRGGIDGVREWEPVGRARPFGSRGNVAETKLSLRSASGRLTGVQRLLGLIGSDDSDAFGRASIFGTFAPLLLPLPHRRNLLDRTG